MTAVQSPSPARRRQAGAGLVRVALAAVAPELGFAPSGPGGAWLRDGVELVPEGEWLGLRDGASAAPADPARSASSVPEKGPSDPAEQLGAPGLWRVDERGHARVHDLPQFRGLAAGELATLVDWAFETRAGRVPEGWEAPARDELEDWIDPRRLGVRAPGLGVGVVRGELVCGDGRLALVFPELARVPDDLEPERRGWLDALLDDAQRRWRLVRFGIARDAGAGLRVRAEVDLSGVPPTWARPLVQLSFDALLWAAGWALSPVSFVADPAASSRALEKPFTDVSDRS